MTTYTDLITQRAACGAHVTRLIKMADSATSSTDQALLRCAAKQIINSLPHLDQQIVAAGSAMARDLQTYRT